MLRGTFNYPDLDVLDSPLMSPTPLTSGIPGSALAEKIFNDPDSWEDNQVEEDDFPVDVNLDRLSWLLAEEVEKYKRNSAISEKAVSLINTPSSAVHHNVRQSIKRDAAGTGLKGIGSKRGSVRPISLAALFENSNDDFSTEIQQQLSKILESGGIPHHIRPYPALSPPSSSDTASSIDSPLQIRTAVTANSGEISPSPINVYSASATLSFLEWYGIYPDSPRLDLGGLPQKSLRMKTPLLQVPSPRHPVRPSSLLSSSETAAPALPPAQRASPVPPPGLEPPSQETETIAASRHPSKSPSPPPVPAALANSDKADQPRPEQTTLTRSESNSSEGRRLPHTAPPPYTNPPTPQLPVVRSSSNGSNHPIFSSRPRRINGGSFDSAQIRRLPSIPPESSGARPPTPPQPQPEAPVERAPSLTRATPSPAPSSLSASNSSTSSAGQQHQAGLRPVSVRSPLGGPAGPRVRSRGREGRGPSISSADRRLAGLRL